MRCTVLVALAVAGHALAHAGHAQEPLADESADWMTRHMAEEHHTDIWDAGSFFALHDYNSDGFWNGDEVLVTYGLMDESNRAVSEERRGQIVERLMALFDSDGDGTISRAEFLEAGVRMPDMGTGPGHHGDDEYEYEIHHWEKYHDENTRLEDLTHPEDIEHFRKHEEMEAEQDRQEARDKMAVIAENIPLKFRRHG